MKLQFKHKQLFWPFLWSFLLLFPVQYTRFYGGMYGLFWGNTVIYFAHTYFCLHYYSERKGLGSWYVALAICLGIIPFIRTESSTSILMCLSLRMVAIAGVVLSTLCFRIKRWWIFALALIAVFVLNTLGAKMATDIWSSLALHSIHITN